MEPEHHDKFEFIYVCTLLICCEFEQILLKKVTDLVILFTETCKKDIRVVQKADFSRCSSTIMQKITRSTALHYTSPVSQPSSVARIWQKNYSC